MKEVVAKPEEFNPNYEERREKFEPATMRPTRPGSQTMPRRARPNEAPVNPDAPQDPEDQQSNQA